ncbi:MAG: PorP/SprF family type IX secretion system membrane protein [Saprospiraceae bacterium]|nr:PorP/SprF family type IX secretion system membrane protein [Saprospiraceae bacterium]
MRKLYVAFIALFAAATTLRAQDPLFSQFYAAPLQLNPAFAGSAFAPRLGVNYRHQWPGFDNAYRTYSAYYEQSLDRLNSGIGFLLEGDNAGNGIYKTTRFSAIYAYQLNISDDLALKLGVEAGVHQTALNWDKLTFPDQIDDLNGVINPSAEVRPDNTNKAELDISSGLLLMGRKYWMGGALKHLNTPNETFLLINQNLGRGLPLRYTLHGGGLIELEPGNKLRPASFISPNFLFATQGPYRQLNLGAYAGVGAIFGGAWFRHTFSNSDAVILLAGFRQGIVKFGVSYDITVSGLAGRTGGAYEVSLGIALDQDERLKNRKKQSNINDCLRMFQ